MLRPAAWLLLVAAAGSAAADETPAPPLPSLRFSAGFSDDMVLQRGPAKAAVYGFGAGPVTVKVAGTDGSGAAVSYSVSGSAAASSGEAAAAGEAAGEAPGHWKAFLRPAAAGGSYTVTASGAGGSATLERVTFGDVYFCSGQSNSETPFASPCHRTPHADAGL